MAVDRAPFWEADHSLTALTILLALLIFVVLPVADLGFGGRVLVEVVFAAILLSGIATAAQAHRWFRVLQIVAIVVLAARILALFLTSEKALLARPALSFVYCTLLAIVVGERVLRAGKINAHRILGAVAVYLLFGLIWALAYEIVFRATSNSFHFAVRPDSAEDVLARLVYFSFTTLTTVGYGDISAVHPVARSAAILEALVGQLFPAILIARLVGLSIRDPG